MQRITIKNLVRFINICIDELILSVLFVYGMFYISYSGRTLLGLPAHISLLFIYAFLTFSPAFKEFSYNVRLVCKRIIEYNLQDNNELDSQDNKELDKEVYYERY